MIKINEAIIVEGRYDKEKISNIIDTTIIETRGFRIFKDKEKIQYIKKLATERGIVILTDSDSAGFIIRNHLKSFVKEEYIKNAYIPQLKGKEKRKDTQSAEGLLGVEGMTSEVILEALNKAGVGNGKKSEITYTTKDLFNLGITGKENSSELKAKLLRQLELPSYLNNKDILKYLNQNVEKTSKILENF